MKLTEREIFLLKIGKRLQELRKQKGYSNHEDFAYDLDMTRSQYWEYEKGKKNMTIYTLSRILNVLKVSLNDFFSEGF